MKEKIKRYLKKILTSKQITLLKKLVSLPGITGKKISTPFKELSCYLKYGSRDIFSILVIETHSACNRTCSYCPDSKFDRGLQSMKEMPTAMYQKIVDELHDVGWQGEIAYAFFSEPLIDERLPDLLNYTQKKLPRASLAIYTNGDYLTISLYKKLMESGLTRLIITHHSEQMTDSVCKLLNYRQENPDDVKVTCQARPLWITNRGGIIKLRDIPEIRIIDCTWHMTTTVIDHTGTVTYCCQDFLPATKLGNLENESLLDIWRKPFYVKLRTEIRDKVYQLKVCQECKRYRWSDYYKKIQEEKDMPAELATTLNVSGPAESDQEA